MSSLIENRACFVKTGRSIHFCDSSWKKSRKWKVYKGYSRDEIGQMKEWCVTVPVNEIWNEDDCDREIKKYHQIKNVAMEFNQINSDFKIQICIPKKAIIDRTAGVHNLKGRRRLLSCDEWVLVFEKMKEIYTFVGKDGGRSRSRPSEGVLEAFVHFTYIQSDGQSVVSKLRGVRRDSCYTLSSPRLNVQTRDIRMVMDNHRCNRICERFQRVGATSPLPVSPGVHNIHPSAPPQEDSESDDDVVQPTGSPKHGEVMAFELQMDNMNQSYVIPCHFTSDNCGYPEPPPYSSQCPEGHFVATLPYGLCDVNRQRWNMESHLLVFGDTASVQQSSVNSEL